MPVDNVVDATARFEARVPEEERKPTILDRTVEELASLARVPPEIRPTLASGLGRLAAQISPTAPLKGAKMMFEQAFKGWQEKWPKRRRLIRLPEELADQAHDYGAYVGGGPPYLALAKAAAFLLAGKRPPKPREIENAYREMLRGTKYLPEGAPLTASIFAARDLLGDWATGLCSRIQTETRLPELIKVLQVWPLTTEILDDVESVRAEPAGEAALGATTIRGFHEKESVNRRFVQTTEDDGLRWAEPSIRIGRLAGKVTVPTFILPPEISDCLRSSRFDVNEDMLPNKVRDWFLSVDPETKDKRKIKKSSDFDKNVSNVIFLDNICYSNLPDKEWSEGDGYGWRDLEFFRSSDVYLTVKNTNSTFEIVMIFTGEGEWGTQPHIPVFDAGRDLLFGVDPDLAAGQYFSNRGGYDFQAFAIAGLNHRYEALHWPEETEYGENCGNLIGLICPYRNSEIFEEFVKGWLDNPEISALLLTADRWRFFPEIACPAAPVPCATQSVAAALFRNLAGAPIEMRLDNILIEQANSIAKAGLAYHEAVVDHYRNSLAASRTAGVPNLTTPFAGL